jgi:hypothetical protein
VTPLGSIAGHRWRDGCAIVQPSLRDFAIFFSGPGLETPGYYQAVPPGRKGGAPESRFRLLKGIYQSESLDVFIIVHISRHQRHLMSKRGGGNNRIGQAHFPLSP